MSRSFHQQSSIILIILLLKDLFCTVLPYHSIGLTHNRFKPAFCSKYCVSQITSNPEKPSLAFVNRNRNDVSDKLYAFKESGISVNDTNGSVKEFSNLVEDLVRNKTFVSLTMHYGPEEGYSLKERRDKKNKKLKFSGCVKVVLGRLFSKKKTIVFQITTKYYGKTDNVKNYNLVDGTKEIESLMFLKQHFDNTQVTLIDGELTSMKGVHSFQKNKIVFF